MRMAALQENLFFIFEGTQGYELDSGIPHELYWCLMILRYSIHNDHISYLVNGWWYDCKYGIVLKSLLNENYPP
jgi:hypothetical protein